jgi:hypothetical protein
VLLDSVDGEGMIVSCYARLTPGAVGAPAWSSQLKNEASVILRRLDDDTARARFSTELALIQRTLAEIRMPKARGVAIFSASRRGLLRVLPLAVPIADRLVLDEEPYLVPLLEAVHRQRGFLAVLTDSHRARLYDARWGHLRMFDELEHDIPRRQKSAGETWGKQQATIARHRDDLLLHYRKALAERVETAWRGGSFWGLILLGDHETVVALREMLPASIAARVVHAERSAWLRSDAELEQTIDAVLQEILSAHDARLLAELEDRLKRNYLVAAGPQEVVNALRNGQVGYPGFLVLEPDRGDKAARCRGCGSVFTTMPSRCAYCQGACETVNLWQEILLFAARHGITAHTVESHPLLAGRGGVAAVLSRAEPWEAGPEPPAGPPAA